MFSKKISKTNHRTQIPNDIKSKNLHKSNTSLRDRIEEKQQELNDVFLEYEIMRLLVLNDLNYLETGVNLTTTHPEIFFSSEIFEKFDVLKLLKRGIFRKVNR